MFGSLLSSIGGSIGQYLGGTTIGKFLGGGILSSIGRYAGRHLGNYLENKWFHEKEVFHKYANIKESFSFSMAEYGAAIPLVFGKVRLQGKIFWIDKIQNIEENTSSSVNFPKAQFMNWLPNQTKSTTHYTDYKYQISFAMCICEGEIQDIGRIWNGDELIDIKRYKFRLYKGNKDQMPDPLIYMKMNNQAPAFRDLAYIVFEDLPLSDFGDVIPNFSFEVIRKANVPNGNMLEDIVESMIMIPGSGEYVYDTIVQSKTILGAEGEERYKEVINSHNIYNMPNSLHSLNQIKGVCENIKWIAPVVCWFGNSINLAECSIKPAVEFKDDYVRYSEEWIVGDYNRETAHEITKDENNNPRYGGSINDQSVIRYLTELKKRGYKIMFYPMFFMDVYMKPWRGHLTGAPGEVANFFHKEDGYNKFILHYANLVKDHVDAFLIGTELIGLTKIKDSFNNFPAVNEFVALAEKVKNIVGQNVQVGYAADWSEYHHTEGGWYNLDPLWASNNIDFIGIDAYFPVTDNQTSFITNKELETGFCSGECYDYYFLNNDREKRYPLEPAYALKNLKYWWENRHKNPDDTFTPWVPKSKKIWFTEYGFPTINKSPNQPNVFFDPFCSDGGAPRYSNEEIDFLIQRRCIRAFIEYWGKEEYVDNMFLWTWDARPYPAWPHMDIWKDGYLWEKGHWVNDKFGFASVASIILEISKRCNLDLKNIDVKTVDEVISGVVFNRSLSGHDAINTLRSSCFFDISASNEQKISFLKRGQKAAVEINPDDLIKFTETSYIREISIATEQIISKVDIYFQDQLRDYETNYVHLNSEKISSKRNASLHLPFVLPQQEAMRIASTLLQNAASENKIIQFNLPISYSDLEPTDFILLECNGVKYNLRILKITIKELILSIVAVIDDAENYHNVTLSSAKHDLFYKKNIELAFEVLDLSFRSQGYDFPHLNIVLNSNSSLPLYVKIKHDITASWAKIAMIEPSNSIATVVGIEEFNDPNFFLIDEVSRIEICGSELEKLDNSRWKLAKLDNELIAFKNIEKRENDIYFISSFIRGCYGTEKYAAEHNIGSKLVIINQPNIIPISEDLIGQEVEFRVGEQVQSICFQNKANKPIPPIIILNVIENSILHLEWMTRNYQFDNWYKRNRRLMAYTIKLTCNNEVHNFETQAGENKMDIDVSEFGNMQGYVVEMF